MQHRKDANNRCNEEVYSARRQQYKHYNDNEHTKTDMYVEHCIKY